MPTCRQQPSSIAAIAAKCGFRVLGTLLVLGGQAVVSAEPVTHPLVPGSNSLFFSTSDGRHVALGGSQIWENMSDQGTRSPPPPLDWTAHLDWLEARGHNLIRLWSGIHHNYKTSECSGDWYMDPVPWARSSVAGARDGGNLFDLQTWNPAWFDRLYERAQSAGERGMYVMVTLFDGWDLENNGGQTNQFRYHPFNSNNNVDAIGFNADTEGWRVLRTPADGGRSDVQAVQRAYIRRVMDTLEDLPNVIFEVANEAGGDADLWEEWVVDEVQAYRVGKTYEHPIVRSYAWKTGASNGDLYASSAEGVIVRTDQSSPAYQNPPATLRQAIFTDGDHNCGVCNGMSANQVARMLLNGNQYLVMDAWASTASCYGAQDADNGNYEPVRYTLGKALEFLNTLDLSLAVPAADVIQGSGYAMGHVDTGFVVLVTGGTETIDLSATTNSYRVEWYNMASSTLASTPGTDVSGGGPVALSAPGSGSYLALLAVRQSTKVPRPPVLEVE